jgi:steroid 5-alpha reductase family enzyme
MREKIRAVRSLGMLISAATYIVALAVAVLVVRAVDPGYPLVALGLGVLVTTGAIVLAYAADEQLRAFRNDPADRGLIMRSGLWAHSRHPNYLGEVSTWWGLWLFALAAGIEWWWTVVGAVAINAMFAFVSIPMMERRLLATRAGYDEYRQCVPMLLPRLYRKAAATESSD